MRLTPINEAEAIIEPFWDGGSSEYPKDKYSPLSEYEVTAAPGADAVASQLWYCVEAAVRSGPPGPALTISRACSLDIGGYDVFRVFGALPGNMRLTVRACVDDAATTVIDGYAGVNDTDEIDGAICGERMTGLELVFSSADGKPCDGIVMWLGLANRAAQSRMEARRCAWPPDWPGHFLPKPGAPRPQIGMLVGGEALDELRRGVSRGETAVLYGRLREKAMEDMAAVPEEIIGDFVPCPDRFTRRRDMARRGFPEAMERLAFVGLVEGDSAMSRMACRMALSAACCRNWCESEMGAFPGATWHHRSFTEETYCRAAALVLDWAGHCLTPHGRQVILDAIAMKGLPRIESDFKRMEYIRSMNQGLVFSMGRITGLIALSQYHPRYRAQVIEAERDLFEMLGRYIHGDGGTLEGMNYWSYTFACVMVTLKALSAFRGIPFPRYVPENVLRTGGFALAMRTTAHGGAAFLPIGDAHPGEGVSPALAAAYYGISQQPEWKELYRGADERRTKTPGIFEFLFTDSVTDGEPGAASAQAGADLAVFGDIGYARLTGPVRGVGQALFFYMSGPLVFGHYHEDKGSFILEAGGEVLAMDRGVLPYSHPESRHMKRARYHNLLYPESEAGMALAQPPSAPGGRLGTTMNCGGLSLLASSQKDAWEAGVFDANDRRVVSPAPGLYVVDDDVRLPEARRMTFNVNSPHPARRDQDGGWRIEAGGAALRVLPLNWTPEETFSGEDGVDGAGQPAYRLGLTALRARAHRLLTLLEVLPAGDGGRYRCKTLAENAVEVASEGMTLVFDIGTAGLLRVRLREADGSVQAAACRGIAWALERQMEGDGNGQ